MPVSLIPEAGYFKSQDGSYKGFNVLTDQTLADQIAALTEHGESFMTESSQVIEGITNSYNELSRTVAALDDKLLFSSSISHTDSETGLGRVLWIRNANEEYSVPTEAAFQSLKELVDSKSGYLALRVADTVNNQKAIAKQDGTLMTYAEVKQIFDAKEIFMCCVHDGIIHVPYFDTESNNYIEFIGVHLQYGQIHVSSVTLHDDDSAYVADKTAELTSNKATALTYDDWVRNATSYSGVLGEINYPSLKSVKNYVDGSIASIDNTSQTLADDLTLQMAALKSSTELSIDKLFSVLFDGTEATYRKLMKSFFDAHDANDLSPEDLTALVERWYRIGRTGWDGWTEFTHYATSNTSVGIRGGDNKNLICTPSTNETKNTDAYAGLPLFAVTDCNWIVNDDLDIIITAIDGITANFERDNPDKYVGVLQMNGYHWMTRSNDGTSYTHGYTDTYTLAHGSEIAPLPESIRVDGTERSWVLHAKYMAAVTPSGQLTCCSGVVPTARSLSHNAAQQKAQATGVQYSGGSVLDYSFLQLMAQIKYASKTLDNVLQGCTDFNFRYTAAYGESDTKRILVTEPQSANFHVGCTVLVGISVDRMNSSSYMISGENGFTVTDIQTVQINGNNYGAITVDAPIAFNTVAGMTSICTWQWKSGSCDNVLGNDGSPDSPASGHYPAKLQGIEYAVGCYEVFSDVILKLYQSGTSYFYEPYTVDRTANQATAITSNYKASGLKAIQPASRGWRYIEEMAFKDGIFFSEMNNSGSSSTGTRDGFYMESGAVGEKQWLAFGSMSSGNTYGGLSYLVGDIELFDISRIVGPGCRLSPNGNRGTWTRA